MTYVSPEVRPETRTAAVRVEVDNRGAQLRFGMFVTVALEGASREGVVEIPRA